MSRSTDELSDANDWQGSEADGEYNGDAPTSSQDQPPKVELADESFDFDQLGPPKEKEVTWKGKRYILREASEGAVTAFKNVVFRSTKLGPEGKPQSVEGMAEAEPLLVAGCLFPVGMRDGKEVVSTQSLSLVQIKEWPSRLTKRLLAWIRKYSEMIDEMETEEVLEKNIKELQVKLKAKREGQERKLLKAEPVDGTGISG